MRVCVCVSREVAAAANSHLTTQSINKMKIIKQKSDSTMDNKNPKIKIK